jgi:hypothetical protein
MDKKIAIGGLVVVVASGFLGTNFCCFSTKNGGNVEKLCFIKYKFDQFFNFIGKKCQIFNVTKFIQMFLDNF